MIKSRNRKVVWLLPVIFALTFVSGVTAGSLIARFSPGDIVVTRVNSNTFSTFSRSFLSFLKPCFLIWVFGYTGISEYVSAAVLAYRGSLFGYVTAYFFSKPGFWSGLKTSLAASLPHNLVFFPFLLFLSLAASKKRNMKPAGYLIILALSILVSAFSAVIDTFITSQFINHLL